MSATNADVGDNRSALITSGRAPSPAPVLWGSLAAAAAVAAVAGVLASSLAVAVGVLVAWAVLLVVVSYRAIALWARCPALPRARRELKAAGNRELFGMVAETADGLEKVVVDVCVEADILGHGLFIQVDEGDGLVPRYAALGFISAATVAMPWGDVQLIVRPSGTPGDRLGS